MDETATEFYAGSQTDHAVLQQIVDEYSAPNVVADDGSRIMNHMIATSEVMYNKVDPNGVYMTEDVNCSYDNRFDGGMKRDGTIIGYTKELLDRLHLMEVWEMENPPEPDWFTLSTHSINIYDSVIAFERRQKAAPESITTGGYPRFDPRPVLPSTLDSYRDRKRENRENERRRRQLSSDDST